MKNYEKPILVENEELSEGIYLAGGSGTTGSYDSSGPADCYTVTWNIHQKPQTGRGDFRIQVDAAHNASDGHHSGRQVLVMTFNQSVEYSGSNGTYVSGSGTNTLTISFSYHNNAVDNIGMGDVIVTSEAGLDVTSARLICNHNCGQH